MGVKGVSEGETLGPFQTWLTAATKWEHQGLLPSSFFNGMNEDGIPFFNRMEVEVVGV